MGGQHYTSISDKPGPSHPSKGGAMVNIVSIPDEGHWWWIIFGILGNHDSFVTFFVFKLRTKTKDEYSKQNVHIEFTPISSKLFIKMH